MDNEMAQSDVRLKLLIDTKSERVIFGEADKNFIDFLFNLLSLPLGTAINLLEKPTAAVGSLGNVYTSVETLSDTYFQPNQTKEALLKPKVSIFGSTSTIMLLPVIDSSSSTTKNTTFYLCNRQQSYYGTRCHHFVSDGPNAICPNCNYCMTRVGTYVKPKSSSASTQLTNIGDDEVGFVKDVVSYMVMGDLTVKPMSAISSMTLLKEFNIKEIGVLEEKVVTLNLNEVIFLSYRY